MLLSLCVVAVCCLLPVVLGCLRCPMLIAVVCRVLFVVCRVLFRVCVLLAGIAYCGCCLLALSLCVVCCPLLWLVCVVVVWC